MKITPKQAERYVNYRTRYLFGPGGVYTKEAPPCTAIPGAGQFGIDDPPTFLSRVGSDPATVGSYLNVDKMELDTDGFEGDEIEEAPVTNLNYGDSTIYASYAAMNFAAEYAITLEEEPLTLTLNILKSFQRLGTYQAGFNDVTSPHGFMLRGDSPDTQDSENICRWKQDSDDARDVEPSYDQYCGLLSSLRVIQILIDQSPSKPEHNTLRGEIRDVLRERILSSVTYLSSSFWTILFFKNGTIPRVARRGPYCLHAAFPFAKTAAHMLATDFASYFGHTFPLSEIAGFSDTSPLDSLMQSIVDQFTTKVPSQIEDFLYGILIDNVFGNAIGGALDEVIQMVGGEGDVRDAIKDVLGGLAEVVNPLNAIIEELLNGVGTWIGMALGAAAIPFSAFLHRYYSKFMLQNLQDELFMTIGELISLMGITKPDNPHFEFSFSITFSIGSPPGWWPRDPFTGDPIGWEAWSRTYSHDFDYEIPLDPLWDIPLPIGILDQLGMLVTGVTSLERKPDLQMLVFLSNVAADTFGLNLINPVDSSYEIHNAFMMALTYRVFPEFFEGGGSDDNLRRFHSVMELLNSAPEDFPKRRNSAGAWNQNFRWMRGTEDDVSDILYPGMDYMLPLMLAGSKPSDVADNRTVILNAMAPPFPEDDSMGPFKLPFHGPYASPLEIYVPQPGSVPIDHHVLIAVVFDRGRGNGKVVLQYQDLNGADQEHTFKISEPSKLIAVPAMLHPISAKITDVVKGHILVAPAAP